MRKIGFLTFIRDRKYKGKTKVYQVYNNAEVLLGIIKWYPPWRKYCMMDVDPDVVFDEICLAEIDKFMCKLKEETRRR